MELNSTSPIPNDELAVVSKKLKSVVWNHFTRQKINGQLKVVCNQCNGKLVVGGRTNHLHKHLLRCPCCKQPAIKNAMFNAIVNKGKVQVRAFSFDHDTLRRELANMIIKHEYPLSMVEHSGFRKFVSSLQPMFKVISRNTLKKNIFKRYEYEKSKIMKLLASNQSRIFITTDLWTSNQNMGYMVVTTHFIDNS